MSALDWLLDNDPAKCDEMLCMEIYCSVSDDFVHCTILMSTKEVSHKQAQVGPVPSRPFPDRPDRPDRPATLTRD